MSKTQSNDIQSQQRGLIVASALCTLAAALLLIAYALWGKTALLGALGMQLAAASMSVWAFRHERRVHAYFSAAASPGSHATQSAAIQRPSRWGNDDRDSTSVDDLRSALEEDALHERHFHFLFFRAGPAFTLGAMALYGLFRSKVPEESLPQTQAIVFGLLSLAASCAWVVLRDHTESLTERQLCGAGKLALVFRESQWASLVGAAGLLGNSLLGST